jgi:hypothetical protein
LKNNEHKTFLAVLGLATFCLLAGCGPRAISTTATIRLESSTSAEMAEAGRILKARFDEIPPSYSSSVTVIVGPLAVLLQFRGEAPSDQTIRDYASQGIFRIYPLDSPLNWLVTDRDVDLASARQGENGAVLDMVVSEKAGQRLFNYTSRNVGRLLVTSWNGKEQSRATVSGVFSRRFQTTGMDRDTALRMMTILKFGRLPKPVREIEIEHAPPED